MIIDAPGLTLDAIKQAAVRIDGWARETPLIENDILNDRVGARVFLKCENLQRTGSFKFRGAYNAVAQLTEDERRRGIIAVSSGNHAQGIAEAARLVGAQSTIVMPRDAPSIKVERVRRAGGAILFYDRVSEDRVAIARAIERETCAIFIHPFDDLRVMAGQGTAGLETLKQVSDRGVEPKLGLVCCGGGGLCAGVSTAWRDAFPAMDIVAVEPDNFDDTRRSFESGRRETNAPGHTSICDAILTETPGEITFPINVHNHVRAVAVPDEAVWDAMAFALRELKMIVEPGGAVCLAALLSGRVDCAGRPTVALLSGGNADETMIAQALSHAGTA